MGERGPLRSAVRMLRCAMRFKNFPLICRRIRAVSPQTHDPEAIAAFDRELAALPPPRRELVSFDLRMAL